MDLGGQTLFDCSSDIEPFRRYHITIGHHEENSFEDKVYECLRCSFVTYSVCFHLRHRLFGKCATTGEEEMKQLECCRDEEPTSTSRKGPLQERADRVNPGTIHIEPASFESDLWECKQCPCKYKQKFFLTRHITSCHLKPGEINWFKCDQCSSKFKWECYLKRHIINHHSKPEDIQWFACDQCPLKFKHRGNLNRHTKRFHSKPEDFRFKCDECTAKFKEKHNLRFHVTQCHTKPEDIQWVECDQCPFRCKDRRHLKSHTLYRHSKPEDIQWFACAQCPARFKQKGDLKRHTTRVHSQPGGYGSILMNALLNSKKTNA